METFEKIRAGAYKVFLDGELVGKVYNDNGIWKSYTPDMRKVSGINQSRKEAVETLIPKKNDN